MPYKYSFDSSDIGLFRLPKKDYQFCQEGLQSLLSKIVEWNNKSLQHGAPYPPYEMEIEDLEGMIEFGQSRLTIAAHPHSSIILSGISVGSMRYIKAGLVYLGYTKQIDIVEKENQNWPNGALQPLRDNIRYIYELEQAIKYPPSDILYEIMPSNVNEKHQGVIKDWDAFICHASEDKEDFVRPLALKLQESGLKVWYDDFTLKIGDSLRRSIEKGLSSSRFRNCNFKSLLF